MSVVQASTCTSDKAVPCVKNIQQKKHDKIQEMGFFNNQSGREERQKTVQPVGHPPTVLLSQNRTYVGSLLCCYCDQQVLEVTTQSTRDSVYFQPELTQGTLSSSVDSQATEVYS